MTAFLYILVVCIFFMKSRAFGRDSLSDGKLRNLKVAKCRSGREVCRISIFFHSFFFSFWLSLRGDKSKFEFYDNFLNYSSRIATMITHALLPSDLVAQSLEQRWSNSEVVSSIPAILCLVRSPISLLGPTISGKIALQYAT